MMLKLNQHIIDEKKNTPLTINEINKLKSRNKANNDIPFTTQKS